MRTAHTPYMPYRSNDSAERLRHIERLSHLMDSQFTIPGTRFRFGLDPLIGLIPGFGNLATFLVSAALVRTMAQHGASGEVVIRMALNVVADAVIGAIPIVGNVFDFFFRANERNLALLRRHYVEGRHQGSGRLIAAGILAAVVCFLVGALWITWMLVSWLWHALI